VIRNSRFGAYGGCYVPETLYFALQELDDAWRVARRDRGFRRELDHLLEHYVGRPSPLYEARRLSAHLGGRARIFLKREDLNHTGAHKINNSLGQALLALRLRKHRIIAETGAGQHGVAAATAAALLGMQCRVYMGAVDVERQRPNVQRMKLLGAEVVAVESGTKTLKDATNEAIRDWVTHVRTTHYVIGSTVGPAPYPRLVRDLQSVIGREARRQMVKAAGRLPHAVVACVGGGSNALGIFSAFLKDRAVALIGVEGGGSGRRGATSATLTFGSPGVLHGSRSYLLQDARGQVEPTHSISAGLDYPGVGPEHAFLKDSGRVSYVQATDDEAVAAFVALTRFEGILPALESSHALAHTMKLARKARRGTLVLVNLSGRGDKDLEIVERRLR
jgi:tryptophan synthase beta chain